MPKKSRRSPAPAKYKDIGDRLRAFREGTGYDGHKDFVSSTSITHNAYSEWESGTKRIGLNSALKLIKRHDGLTLDFIYRGKTGSLDVKEETRRRIADALSRYGTI